MKRVSPSPLVDFGNCKQMGSWSPGQPGAGIQTKEPPVVWPEVSFPPSFSEKSYGAAFPLLVAALNHKKQSFSAPEWLHENLRKK